MKKGNYINNRVKLDKFLCCWENENCFGVGGGWIIELKIFTPWGGGLPGPFHFPPTLEFCIIYTPVYTVDHKSALQSVNNCAIIILNGKGK